VVVAVAVDGSSSFLRGCNEGKMHVSMTEMVLLVGILEDLSMAGAAFRRDEPPNRLVTYVLVHDSVNLLLTYDVASQ
jgi:hypothetical protein